MRTRLCLNDLATVKKRETGCTPEGGVVEAGEVVRIVDEQIADPAIWCIRQNGGEYLLIRSHNLAPIATGTP